MILSMALTWGQDEAESEKDVDVSVYSLFGI